jgi:hypothetical protein
MKTSYFLTVAALVLAVTGEGRAVVLTGTQNADFTTTYSDDLYLHDSSTGNLRPGGRFPNAYVYENALLQTLGGDVTGYLRAYNTSTVNVISGGVGSFLEAYDISTVNMSGGSVSYLRAYNTGTVNITGGLVYTSLVVQDTGGVNIYAGTVSSLSAYNTSSVKMSGGTASRISANQTSTVTVTGGTVGSSYDYNKLYAYDTSTLNVSGGTVNGLLAYESSRVNVSGGTVTDLLAYETSTVIVSNGLSVNNLWTRDTSTMHMSSGTAGKLYAYNTSTVNLTGGTISEVSASGTGTLNMTGGTVSKSLSANSSGIGNISGGSVKSLLAYDTSNITFYGHDFQATAGLSLDGDRVLGTGELTGKWLDGTSWTTSIQLNAAGATIRAVPEPSTFAWRSDRFSPTNWGIAANWTPAIAVPDGVGIKVSFGSQVPANNIVDIGAVDRTVGSLAFAATTATTIQSTGGKSVTLDNGSSAATISVAGNHVITAAVLLNSDVNISGTGNLTLSGGVSGDHALNVLSGSLTAKSIQVDTLTIGSGVAVSITPSVSGTAVDATATVPEPSTFVLSYMGAIGLLIYTWQRWKPTV